MSIQDRIKIIKSDFKIYPLPYKPIGGQHCGIPNTTIRGEHEDLGISIEISYHRSAHKNKELVSDVIDLILMDIIR